MSFADSPQTILLGERLGKGKECSPDRRGQVDLLRESNACIVLDNPDRLVHTSGEVQGIPIQQIRAKVVYSGNAVFDRLHWCATR